MSQNEKMSQDIGPFDQSTNPIVLLYNYEEGLLERQEKIQSLTLDDPSTGSSIQGLFRDVQEGTEVLKLSNAFVQAYMNALTSLRSTVGGVCKIIVEKLQKEFVPFVQGEKKRYYQHKHHEHFTRCLNM